MLTFSRGFSQDSDEPPSLDLFQIPAEIYVKCITIPDSLLRALTSKRKRERRCTRASERDNGCACDKDISWNNFEILVHLSKFTDVNGHVYAGMRLSRRWGPGRRGYQTRVSCTN
jgi:hypothetical protein